MEENTQKALDSAISQIEKDHGKGALMKLGSGSAVHVPSLVPSSDGV